MHCRFCEKYLWWKSIDEERAKRMNLGRFEKSYKVVYKAALCSIARRKNDKGKWYDAGKYTEFGYALKYCPSCGTDLKKVWSKG